MVGLHKNHVNLVKFASEDDEDYQTGSNHLVLMVRDAPAKIARLWREDRQPTTNLARSVTSPIRPSGTVQDGIYKIQNFRSGAYAALQDGTSSSSLISFIPGLGLEGGDVVSFIELHSVLSPC